MRQNPEAQRDYREPHAREYADNFDLEGFGYPVVNLRDGVWYIIDGQHRIGALRIMGWDDQQIECEAFEGLTEAEEAELFLKRNHRRAVKAFDQFRVAVTANREEPSDINRIVQTQGLKVSEAMADGCISAVTSLQRIYDAGGAHVLAKSLRIARDAYGKDRTAFRGDVLLGIGLVCARYDGQLDESFAIQRLATMPGGPLGLVGKAQSTRRLTGHPLPKCIAATVVEVLNRGLRRNRLEEWWKK
jgi:hypothetical protein